MWEGELFENTMPINVLIMRAISRWLTADVVQILLETIFSFFSVCLSTYFAILLLFGCCCYSNSLISLWRITVTIKTLKRNLRNTTPLCYPCNYAAAGFVCLFPRFVRYFVFILGMLLPF